MFVAVALAGGIFAAAAFADADIVTAAGFKVGTALARLIFAVAGRTNAFINAAAGFRVTGRAGA